MRRTVTLLPAVVIAAVVLAGCSAEAPEPTPTPDTALPQIGVCEAPAGEAVDSIEVAGEFSNAPAVTFPTPLRTAETQRVVAIEGEEAAPGELVSVAYALYDGTTGELLETFGWAEGDGLVRLRADYASVQAGFAQTIGCAGPGTRVVGVIPAAGTEDVIVFVADVVADHVWETDLPEVTGPAENPTLTIPDAAPKTDIEIAVLTEGDGAVVTPASSVVAHYLGTAWETGEVFDSSFARGAPSPFSVQGVVEGFKEALIGQTVGSRVLVTMPPRFAYGEAGQSDHRLAGLTLVFLIDIVSLG